MSDPMLSYYVFTGGLWCRVLDLGVSPFDHWYLALTNTGHSHMDEELDELLDTVQFFGDTRMVYFPKADDERRVARGEGGEGVMLTCYMCGVELPSDLDAYGAVGEEICQSCYLMLAEESASVKTSWYGMAPHEHIPLVNQAGKKVGHVTVLIDYSDRPQQDGWYEIEPGLWFYPDAEVDGGQGIWEDRREAGR